MARDGSQKLNDAIIIVIHRIQYTKGIHVYKGEKQTYWNYACYLLKTIDFIINPRDRSDRQNSKFQYRTAILGHKIVQTRFCKIYQ